MRGNAPRQTHVVRPNSYFSYTTISAIFGALVGIATGLIVGISLETLLSKPSHSTITSCTIIFALIGIKVGLKIGNILDKAKTETIKAHRNLYRNNKKLNKAKKNLDSLRKLLTAAKHNAQELKQKIVENSGEISTLQLKLNQANEHINNLDIINRKQSKKLHIAGICEETYKTEQLKLEREKSETENLIALLKETVDRLSKENHQLQAQHKAVQEKAADLEASAENIPANQAAFFMDLMASESNARTKQNTTTVATRRQSFII